jgi:integrase
MAPCTAWSKLRGRSSNGLDFLVWRQQGCLILSPDGKTPASHWRLPRVMFHALRHTHASALIAAGLDVVKISRRLGHGSPAVTPNVYGHLFDNIDVAAANAIEIALTPVSPGGTVGEH